MNPTAAEADMESTREIAECFSCIDCEFSVERACEHCGETEPTRCLRHHLEHLASTHQPLTRLQQAVAKARGDILTEADMKQNIDFLNKAARIIKQ